jgi:membrane protease YdiL (CAAX protease family)
LLLPPVRRLAARWIPIRADSAVHAVALSFSMLVLVNLAVTVGLGIRNLASALETSAGSEAFNPAPALWVQQLAFVAMALVGVGWLSRRSLVEALKRLGVVWPGLVQAVSGLGAGVGLALAVLVLEYLVSKAGVSTDAAVEKLTEQLLGPLTKSVSGILTLGIAAGLGEESLFRGALQPRFGLFLTALLFSLLHSTYGLTLSTLFVFLVGLALGLIRTRANTSTTMIVHAIYNMTLGVIAYLGVMQGV